MEERNNYIDSVTRSVIVSAMSTRLQFTAPGVRTLMPPRPWEINRDIFGTSFSPINKHSVANEEKRAGPNSKANCAHCGLESGIGLDSEKIAGSFLLLFLNILFFRAVQLPRCRSVIIDACPQCPVSLFINNTYWWEQVKARTSDSCQDNVTVESMHHSSYDFINKGTGFREGVFVLFEEGWFLVLFCFA